jgi:hypothetical protein
VAHEPEDLLAALPALPLEPFTTRELAACLGCTTELAQRTVYCLRTFGIIETVGKRRHAPLHALSIDATATSGAAAARRA